MSDHSWTESPALAGIDPSRLQLLLSLAEQAKGKKKQELLPFLMSLSSCKNDDLMHFEPSEVDAIISALKVGKSPQEIQKIERICRLMHKFQKTTHTADG